MNNETLDLITDILNYHVKLHGKKGIVEYALVDDIERKIRPEIIARAVIEDIVHKLLKENK